MLEAQASGRIAEIQQQMTNATIKRMIVHQLIQAYHGFFEVPFWFLASRRNHPYYADTTAQLSSANEALHAESRLESMVRILDSRGDLSRFKQQGARKALNMAILAFASQWVVDNPPAGDHLSTGYNAIRTALWYEANWQTQGCTGMNSYQLILATIILALTHPPFEATEAINLSTGGHTPVKRAIAKLFELKNCSNFTSKDDQPINILLWFGLVFEIVFSALKIRTLTTPDENCMVLHQGQKSELWCLSTFKARRRNHSQTGIGILHEEAVPRSILLIRKCIYLREQINVGSSLSELEHSIDECMKIHDFWAETYHGIIDHYLRFPSGHSWRLLSWVVCLRIRWSWSCLVLMEIIGKADDSKITAKFGQICRSYTVPRIRWQNAVFIAEVAQASSTPGPKATLIGFGLLNDPWTGLTIEAMQLALKALSSGTDIDDRRLDARKRSCMDCISLLESRSASIKRFQLTHHDLRIEDVL